jgi:uncharacterized MAPEG superfamily protein
MELFYPSKAAAPAGEGKKTLMAAVLTLHPGKVVVKITARTASLFDFVRLLNSAHYTAGINFFRSTFRWRIPNECGQPEVNAGIAG